MDNLLAGRNGGPMEEQRNIYRYRTTRPAELTLDGGRRVECTVCDLSTSGACLKDVNPVALPDRFVLAIQGQGVRHKCRIAWRSKDSVGVEFF